MKKLGVNWSVDSGGQRRFLNEFQGAHTLSEHLLQKYGKDSVALVVDEGSEYVECLSKSLQ